MAEPPRPTLPPELVAEHRAWTRKLGILDRPWLILGSAPSPTLPQALLATHARVDINNAGLTAERLGLGPADLTLRKKSKPWSEHPNLRTRGLLWYDTAPYFWMRLRLLTLPGARVGSLMRMRRGQRDAMVDAIAGVSPRDAGGDRGKVTNGVAGICYAIMLGVPEIVLAGISLSKDGHSYNGVNRQCRQVSEDAYVLSVLKDRPDLLTTEPDLAEDAGIRLWRDG